MSSLKIDALLALRGNGRLMIGRERIALLESVAELGSISKAAKTTGLSYKTAWEAVNAINNLLPVPVFLTKAGGAAGGGAEVTPEGRRLIETFHRLEARLSKISSLIAAEGLDGQEDVLLWSLGNKISARNIFQTTVLSLNKTAVDVELKLQLSHGHAITALVTNAACEDLALVEGRRTLAIVKAPFVRILPPKVQPDGASNWFEGTISRRTDAEHNCEFLLDIGYGKTLTAVVPIASVAKMELVEGGAATAHFDANHVILAVD